jgi:hypothetical protein
MTEQRWYASRGKPSARRIDSGGAAQPAETAAGRIKCAVCNTGLQLCASYGNASQEHDYAANHDLEHGLKERRIHVARSNPGDGPQLN